MSWTSEHHRTTTRRDYRELDYCIVDVETNGFSQRRTDPSKLHQCVGGLANPQKRTTDHRVKPIHGSHLTRVGPTVAWRVSLQRCVLPLTFWRSGFRRAGADSLVRLLPFSFSTTIHAGPARPCGFLRWRLDRFSGANGQNRGTRPKCRSGGVCVAVCVRDQGWLTFEGGPGC